MSIAQYFGVFMLASPFLALLAYAFKLGPADEVFKVTAIFIGVVAWVITGCILAVAK